MKKFVGLIVVVFQVGITFSQLLDLYFLRSYTISPNQQLGFVSLSDKYEIKKYGDSIEVLPEYPSDIQRIPLNGMYRKRLFTSTNIQETDTMFLYNYKTNTLMKAPVSKLKSFARLNEYVDEDFSQHHLESDLYMYGLEVNEQVVKSIGNTYDVFIYIGNSNPFKTEKMQPFVWKKIKANEFPFSKMDTVQKFTYGVKDLKFHYYKSNQYHYFTISELHTRYLLILDLNGNKINEFTFKFTESCSLAFLTENEPSKEQFVGTIFKNKPEMFFGFENCTFDCEHIMCVDQKVNDIIIKCDNRH